MKDQSQQKEPTFFRGAERGGYRKLNSHVGSPLMMYLEEKRLLKFFLSSLSFTHSFVEESIRKVEGWKVKLYLISYSREIGLRDFNSNDYVYVNTVDISKNV